MQPLKNNRFLKAIAREPVDCTPIWIMRQAGRYLPEYRATRARAGNFMTLCKTPELACEVTLQPLQRYALDAAIIFSDILTIPDAMGLGLHFVENEGPRFYHPLQQVEAIYRLCVPDAEKLAYVYDAIRLVQHELANRIPLIGFCGSPWTLAAYMIEGRAKNNFPTIIKMLKESPDVLHYLLNTLADSIVMHLHHQIQAGVQAVMLFDTWGGLLNTSSYEIFSLHYIKQIIAAIKSQHPTIPLILFTKHGKQWLQQMAASGCDVVGVDWEVSLTTARAEIGKQVALQGNMNPAVLLSSPAIIRQTVSDILAAYGPGSGHVFNLGHGITPDVDPSHVKVLVDSVHELSAVYHRPNGRIDG